MCISTVSLMCQPFLARGDGKISNRVGRSGESIRSTMPETKRLEKLLAQALYLARGAVAGQHDLLAGTVTWLKVCRNSSWVAFLLPRKCTSSRTRSSALRRRRRKNLCLVCADRLQELVCELFARQIEHFLPGCSFAKRWQMPAKGCVLPKPQWRG